MKKIFFLLIFLFAATLQAQIIKIDIDSLVEGSTITSKRWNGKADSVRVIETKIMTVYGDSTAGNVTVVIEWKLDTVKSVKIREDNIKAQKKAQLRALLKAVEDFKAQNPTITVGNQAAKQATPQAVLIEPADTKPKKTPKKQ